MNPLAGIATLMVLLGIAVQFSLHRHSRNFEDSCLKENLVLTQIFYCTGWKRDMWEFTFGVELCLEEWQDLVRIICWGNILSLLLQYQ